METQLVKSVDGTMIAYDVQGTGPAVILLHDLGGDRCVWHDRRVVLGLSHAFTVITLDLRGHGESERFATPERYSLKATLEDVHAVAAACNLPQFMVWGWAFGGTVALHLAARSDHVTRVVAAGAPFGRVFSSEYVQPQLEHWRALQRLKETGELDQLDPDDAAFVEAIDIPILAARLSGLQEWPSVEPAQLKCPALLLGGSEGAEVTVKLHAQRPAMEAAGVECHIFEGMDHLGIVDDTETVLPVVVEFLQRTG